MKKRPGIAPGLLNYLVYLLFDVLDPPIHRRFGHIELVLDLDDGAGLYP